MERSFAEEVKQLQLGQGQVLRGEGILAITKALLQSGVSYVGGYPGAPVSHLLDVMADANESVLKPMGVYLDASASEAAAAALLGASINYPMRGAVTWKSIVGTNVAADALSNLASSGVIGGALIVVGEDYGAGASVIQERTHAFALKSSLCLFDPRPSLQTLARMVEEGFGISEASNLPAVISLRIRAAHVQGSMVCKDNVRPAISMRDRLQRHSFDYSRISHPPSTYMQEAQKFEKRLPAARRYVVERGLNEVIPGEEKEIGIILQGGLTPTALRALELLGRADVFGRSRIPMLVLNVIHPLVPEQLLDFLEGKRRVLVLEEGMPNFIEQELKALAYDRALVRPHRGQGHGGGPGRIRARGRARGAGALPRRRRRDAAGRSRRPCRARQADPRDAAAQAAARLLHGLPGAPHVQRAQDRAARAGRDPRGGRHRLPRLRHAAAVQPGQHHPGLRPGTGLVERRGARLRQARDLDPGRRRLLALGADDGCRQCRLQQAGLDRRRPRELLHVRDGPAVQPLDGQEPARAITCACPSPRRSGASACRGSASSTPTRSATRSRRCARP